MQKFVKKLNPMRYYARLLIPWVNTSAVTGINVQVSGGGFPVNLHKHFVFVVLWYFVRVLVLEADWNSVSVSAPKLTVFVVAFRFRPKFKYMFRSTFGFGGKWRSTSAVNGMWIISDGVNCLSLPVSNRLHSLAFGQSSRRVRLLTQHV